MRSLQLGIRSGRSVVPLVVVWLGLVLVLGAAQAFAQTNLAQIVESAGRVEAFRGGGPWQAVTNGLVLGSGDRIRTYTSSRATVRLTDRSVIRINQDSLVEIQVPAKPGGLRRLLLRFGELFFLNRERPLESEFDTPLASGAIRGTEFWLRVRESDGTTELAVFDGTVDFRTATGAISLTSGQQVLAGPGEAPQMSEGLTIAWPKLTKWVYYYPAVLSVDELDLSEADSLRFRAALEAYRDGELLAALKQLPDLRSEESIGATVFRAGVQLGVGRVDECLMNLATAPPDHPGAMALRELIDAVRRQPSGLSAPGVSASRWLARSYSNQSTSQLQEALAAARSATRLSPGFGLAWIRRGELELGLGLRREARKSLQQGQKLSPRHAAGMALAGFLELDENRPRLARGLFEQAIALDGSLASAWLGHGLAQEALGDFESARSDFQIVAVLEPNRALPRSYLGRSFAEVGDTALAGKDFSFAKRLEPVDPTPWLYSGIHHAQQNRINDSIRDLGESVSRNDSRSLLRSGHQLDQDRAVRNADLASVYQDAGLREAGLRAAERSLADDFANYSSHLFFSRSLSQQDDPFRFDLRNETGRQSELLLANLLANPGEGNLSQILSQNEPLSFRPMGLVNLASATEYRSSGSWDQAAVLFGNSGRLSYGLDLQRSEYKGDRPEQTLDTTRVGLQLQTRLGPDNTLYGQIGWARSAFGDVAQRYDPQEIRSGQKAEEQQEPHLYAGFRHEWSPTSHSLFLVSRLDNRSQFQNPSPGVLFIRYDQDQPVAVQTDPFFELELRHRFVLYGAEAQQIWQTESHQLVAGLRGQSGTVDTVSDLTRSLTGLVSQQAVSGDLRRLSGYLYHQWKITPSVRLTTGLVYDDLTYPANTDLAPIRGTEGHRSQLEPKVGFTYDVGRSGRLRLAAARSLGGLYFDNAIRLEPTQILGFTDGFRSLIPESVAGIIPGATMDFAGIGYDHRIHTNIFLGMEGGLRHSEATRELGAFRNATAISLPDSATWTRECLDYRELYVSGYLTRLLSDQWVVGTRGQVTESLFHTRFPELPVATDGLAALQQDESAVLAQLQVFGVLNHPTGWFAEARVDLYHQSNQGFASPRGDTAFWQQDLFAGYRWPQRRAELRLGLLNLSDQDYRLSPLNPLIDPPRRRTFTVSLRLNF